MKSIFGMCVFFAILGSFYLWAVENWRIGCLYCWFIGLFGFIFFAGLYEKEIKNRDF